MSIQHTHFSQLDSTQNYLREHFVKHRPPENKSILISTAQQTHGHGRQGRSWKSDNGCLMMSFSLQAHPTLTLTALELACLTSQFFHQTSGLNVKIKWPNDLFYNDSKCGGILLQSLGTQTQYFACGIGINMGLDQAALKNLDEGLDASSLPATQVPMSELAFELCQFIHQNRMTGEQIKKTFLEKCQHLNRECSITQDSRRVVGIFTGIGELGEAILKTKNAQKTSHFSGTLRWS